MVHVFVSGLLDSKKTLKEFAYYKINWRFTDI